MIKGSMFVKGLGATFAVIVMLGLLFPATYIGWLVFVLAGSDWWAFVIGHLVAILSGVVFLFSLAKLFNWLSVKTGKGL